MRFEESWLEKIMDVMGALVIVMDVSGKIKYFNTACEKLTGYKFEEVKDLPIWKVLISEEEMAGVKEVFTELKNAHFPNYHENYWITKDGTSKLTNWHNTAITDDNEKVLYVVGTGEDVTEKRKKEKEVLKTQRLLKGTLNAIPDVVGIQYPDHTIEQYNRTGYEILGMNHEEVKGKKCYELIGRESECEKCATSKSVKSKQLEVVEKYIPELDTYLYVRSNPVLDENGKIEYIVEQTQDITDYKKTYIALKESEKKFRSFVENANDLIFTLNKHGDFTYISPNCKRKLNYEPEELIGKSHFDIVHPEDYDKVKYHFEKTISKSIEAREEVEVKVCLKDKEWRWFDIKPTIIEDIEEVTFLAIARDVTERKQAEERIRYISFHDIITGAYNRAYLEEEMKRIDTSRQLPISIIIIDLNGLKLVNDTYGHVVGDEMLKCAAEILINSCRKEDIVARWGGDEFVILLPQTNEEDLEKISKRIKENSQETFVKDVPVSLALGKATKFNKNKKIEGVLKEAEDDMYKQKLAESKSVRSSVLRTLLKTLEAKSHETEAHTGRMLILAWQIGETIGLQETELNRLQLLITLHDIGKVNISEKILTKDKTLTDEEWEEIKKHPEIGFRIARSTEEFSHVAEDILSHHERWDGKGYPRGLKEKEVPMLARITAIADAYDVMSNGRPYKEKMSKEEILDEFKKCAGTQFDPKLVEVFIEVMEKESSDR